MAVERFSPLSVQEMRLPSVAAGKLCPPAVYPFWVGLARP